MDIKKIDCVIITVYWYASFVHVSVVIQVVVDIR
jgi:hypothetical protein